MTIAAARAQIASTLQGLTVNGTDVHVYDGVPRQWSLPAVALAPADPYIERQSLTTVRVNIDIVFAITAAENGSDLDALEDAAIEILNRVPNTSGVSAPEYTDLGAATAATITVPTMVTVPIE